MLREREREGWLSPAWRRRSAITRLEHRSRTAITKKTHNSRTAGSSHAAIAAMTQIKACRPPQYVDRTA